ncbi:MAG: FAD-binding protein [Syntrophotaleaceae bacterium]
MALPDSPCWRQIDGFDMAAGVLRCGLGRGFSTTICRTISVSGVLSAGRRFQAEVSRIGGNIATKASGPHALRYGSIDQFIDSLEFVTAGGELVNTAVESTIPPRLREQLAELEGQLRADRAAWKAFSRAAG